MANTAPNSQQQQGSAGTGGVQEHPVDVGMTAPGSAPEDSETKQETQTTAPPMVAPIAPVQPGGVEPMVAPMPPQANEAAGQPQPATNQPIASGAQPAPAVVGTQPAPGTTAQKPSGNQKELENKAKAMIKELDKMGGSSGSRKPQMSVVKGVMAAIAIIVVGAGTYVGIKILGVPGSQELRQQAAGCKTANGDRNACAALGDCCRWQSSDQTCRNVDSSKCSGSGGGATCDSNSHAFCVGESQNAWTSCVDHGAQGTFKTYCQAASGSSTCSVPGNGIDYTSCNTLPPPSQLTYCQSPALCQTNPDGTPYGECATSTLLVQRCQESSTGTACWKLLKYCANNCNSAQQPATCTEATPTPTLYATPTSAPGGDPNCQYYGGSDFQTVIACGACKGSDDPRDPRIANGNGYGCTNDRTMAHFVCNGLGPFDSRGCADTEVWNGTGTRTFTQDCGTEQIDTSSPTGEHSTATIYHKVPCAVSPTPANTPRPQPSSTPQPSATVPPVPSATVTPQPLVCSVLGVSNTNPTYGQTITLTCQGAPNTDVVRAEYQASINGGTWTALPNATSTTATLSISQVGNYQVRCRVCKDATAASCTAWQGAQ